jgi:hypothetical protein
LNIERGREEERERVSERGRKRERERDLLINFDLAKVLGI